VRRGGVAMDIRSFRESLGTAKFCSHPSGGVSLSSPRHARVSVVVTTKDRREELRNALRTTLRQTLPLELIVIDDGSSDGTSDLVRSEFPKAVLYRSERSEGLVAQRNRGARLATPAVVLWLEYHCEL